MLIAADYALSTFPRHKATFGVYIKLKHVIDLLCAFENDFPLPFKGSTSDDLNMGGTIIIDGTVDGLNSPLGVLYALKGKLPTKVKFPPVSSLLNDLNADKPDKS